MSTSAVSKRPKFFHEPANNTLNPFPYAVAFDTVVALLGVKEIGKMSAVCQLWLNRVDLCGWKKLFEVYGIPRVIGGQRDYKADFKWLYPITLSGYKIGKYFGKVVGKIPDIKQEELDKFKGREFAVVVEPSLIRRTIDSTKTPLTLNEVGNVTVSKSAEQPVGIMAAFVQTNFIAPNEKTVKEGDLTIAFSLRNLIVLSNLEENNTGPALKTKSTPLFWESVSKDAPQQYTTCAPKNSVYLMERKGAEETRGKIFKIQEARMKAEGFEVTSLRPRALFSMIEMQESWMSHPTIRTSDIYLEDRRYQLNLGGFIQAVTGIFISTNQFNPNNYPVVRGWPCSQ